MRAPIHIITGPPGVGKTTLASAVADGFERSAVVEGDAFFRFLRAGRIEPWDPASHAQNDHVTRLTAHVCRSYAEEGWTTILEGIFGPWFLPTLLDEAGDAGPITYTLLGAPLATCIARVEARGDELEPAVVEKMHDQFDRSQVDPRHRVDASGDPAVVLGAVLAALGTGSTVL